MVPEVQQTELFVILGNFFPFQPPDNPENQNFKTEKKQKKPPGNIIILYICTINDNHMMCSFWDMDGAQHRIFCHSGPLFALLPP